MPINLHELPQFADRISWVYTEYGQIEKDDNGLVFIDKKGVTPLPVAALSMVMLGPGTTITHRAAIAAAQMNCLISWVGGGVTRTYASSTGGASQTRNLLRQARLWADAKAHLAVVRKMYEMRFDDPLDENTTLQQIRGREGARVRAAYLRIAGEAGIRWVARRYDPGNWSAADLPNRCLSAANAALYGVVHAALISASYSPALGFIHTGKPLSFVYDIADLYKLELAVRIAFEVAAKSPTHPDREVRKRCREVFHSERLMARVLPDVTTALDAGAALLPENEIEEMFYVGDDGDGLPALPEG